MDFVFKLLKLFFFQVFVQPKKLPDLCYLVPLWYNQTSSGNLHLTFGGKNQPQVSSLKYQSINQYGTKSFMTIDIKICSIHVLILWKKLVCWQYPPVVQVIGYTPTLYLLWV